MSSNYVDAFVLGLLLLVTCYIQEVNSLPSGFIAEPVTSKNAITGVFAKNPRNDWKPMLLLVDKDGTVSVLEDPDKSSSSTEILQIGKKMCTNGERGLQSIAVHPDFEENRYIYLYYTKHNEGCLTDDSESGPWNVVSRFIMDPKTLTLNYDKREEIWRGAPLHDAVHNGGAMTFGNDGKLYVTTGDGGSPENSQDRKNNLGKLIRLNDDGDTPDDNPFTRANGLESYNCQENKGKVPDYAGDDAVCSEIFALGLRNPFRMSIDTNEKEKTLLAISDVGGKVWEEINYAGTDYMGVNYGHKEYEGPCFRYSDQECPASEEFEEPFYWYHHKEKNGYVAGSAFIPKGLWPDQYVFLFIDFVSYNIYTLVEDKENGCRNCIPPIPTFRNETFYHSVSFPGDGKNAAKLVDLFFGPHEDTQALYVIKFGNHDTVLRIRYTDIQNEPPLVNFEIEDKQFDVGDEVLFDGSYSEDPEGDELTFKWYFGDGEKSKAESPTHRYDKPGSYKVTLIVADSLNQLQEISKTIQVGTPPTVNIISPTDGDEFFVGEILRLKGEAFYNDGTIVRDSLLEWEVIKHHSDHYHPFLDPTFGNDFDLFAAPKPEGFYASRNSYLEIFLRVTDENGLVAETNRIIQPTLIRVDVKSNFPGVTMVIEDETVTIPEEIWGWKEQEIQIRAENNPPILFKSWSDGVRERERIAILNFTNPALEAMFCVDDGGKCVIGSETCCIGSCNTNGICSVQVKLPPLYVDTTFSPTNQPTSTPTVDTTETRESSPILPSIFDNVELRGNVEQNVSSNISSAGKVMLSITCLLIAGIVTSFFCMWQCKQQPRNSNLQQINGNGSDEEIKMDLSTSSSSGDDAPATV